MYMFIYERVCVVYWYSISNPCTRCIYVFVYMHMYMYIYM